MAVDSLNIEMITGRDLPCPVARSGKNAANVSTVLLSRHLIFAIILILYSRNKNEVEKYCVKMDFQIIHCSL